MDFGSIIKRSWTITWRYKALWVLGVFAGVSGCQGGGSSGGNSSSGDWGSGGGRDPFGSLDMLNSRALIAGLIAAGVVLAIIGIIWFVLGIAAKGGLVHGVNEIESGRAFSLGDSWRAGWQAWGRIFVLRLLLGLPAFIIAVIVILAIAVPILGPLMAGGEPGPEIIAPICGSLVCGLPVILIVSTAVDLIYLLALRFAVLGDHGAIESIKFGWQTLRARFKDTFILYLLNGALNVAASFVIAIPIIIVAVAVVVPVFVSAGGGEPSLQALIGAIAAVAIVGMVLGIIYSGIWGTYTSAMWTIFFRRLTGMEPLPAPAAYAPAPEAPLGAPPVYAPPAEPPVYAPPADPSAYTPAPGQPEPEQPDHPEPPAPPAPPVAPLG